jgi:hypothetical protein
MANYICISSIIFIFLPFY